MDEADASAPSDEALLDRWREGDKQAGAILIDRHHESLARFFMTKLGPEADDLVQATFLGLLEGATEFIPVSSTGHLILVQSLFGLDGHADKTFAILIQFGAILAILSAYFARLWAIAVALPHDPKARRFVVGVLVAFLPAAVVGVLARDFILGVLFDPRVVCTTLILGGFVLLAIDRARLPQRHEEATRFPLAMYFWIGVIQCLAMIPGVSRSGGTAGALLLRGHDGESAFRLSFLLSIPAAFAAGVLVLFDTGALDLLPDAGGLLAVTPDALGIAPGPAALALAVSAVVGFLTIDALMRVVRRVAFWGVCVGLGALAVVGGVLVGL